VTAGVVALVTLTTHGALYVAIKTEGELSRRARQIAVLAWPVQLLLTGVSLVATYSIQPQAMNNYKSHPIGLLVPLVVVGSLAVMFWAARKESDRTAFLASSIYIAAMLVGAAFALYPVVLPASTNPAYSLTIYNSAAGHHGLVVGVTWWILGSILALAYFVFIYRMFRGKVRLEEGHY
jgi:cytochrome d ubiquinol oxidase subunit II